MDDVRTIAPPAGGNVEPIGTRQQPAIALRIPEAYRYEVRNPFADVTHASGSFDNASRLADRLGALRFTAIGSEGKRTIVVKENGNWVRPERSRTTPTGIAPNVTTRPDPRTQGAGRLEDVDRAARAAQLEAILHERYLIRKAPIRIGDVTIGQTEYRHRGDTTRVAFTESTNRLSTEVNSPSVARSMVDVAEARRWQALRVSGSEDFRRMVWLEASLRGVHTVGYEPVPADQEMLRKERETRQLNRIERAHTNDDNAPPATKQSARGGGRKTVLAALEAVLVAQKVPDRQREAIMASATTNLAQRQRSGETHRVKVYDAVGPVQRPAAFSPLSKQRAIDRTGPSR